MGVFPRASRLPLQVFRETSLYIGNSSEFSTFPFHLYIDVIGDPICAHAANLSNTRVSAISFADSAPAHVVSITATLFSMLLPICVV